MGGRYRRSVAESPPTLLEVGPGVVRVLGERDSRPPTESEEAALRAVDDPVALVDGRPVATAELWRTLLGPGPGPGRLVLVHPSWWPCARVDRVLGLVATGPVTAMARAEAIRRLVPDPVVVVEIAADRFAVSCGDALRLTGRHDLRATVDAVRRLAVGGAVVVVDAARGVPGAAAAATALRNALESVGITAERIDLAAAVPPDSSPDRRRPTPRRLWAATGAVSLSGLVVLGLLGVLALRPRASPPAGPDPSPARWASLVEGRVSVRIPPDWTVRRVTSGPGSRRIEVSSPADPDAVVHITQAYAPGSTLADAAEALRRAVDAEPAGVFTDFRPDDEVGGRPAVTYREVRTGRTVRWTVVLDGATRISVGCQNAAAVCAEAVVSAGELASR